MTDFKQDAPLPTKIYSRLIQLLSRLGFWIRFTLFSLIWILLTGWQPGSWPLGVVFIIMASSLSLYLAPQQPIVARQIKPAKLCSFWCYFFIHSLRGAWVTAQLALKPKQTLLPGVINYPIDMVNESHIFTFMQVISLLPGTVSAEHHGGEVRIHILDLNSFSRADIDDCFARVSKLLGKTKQPLVEQSNY